MATAPKPSLEVLNDVPAEKLNQPCSDEHLSKLALCITDWQYIAPFLGLTEAEEAEIVEDNRRANLRKIKMLRKWRNKQGEKATYGNLAEVLLELEETDLVQKLCKLIWQPQNISRRQPSTQVDPHEENRKIRHAYANNLKEKYRSGVPTFLTLRWPPALTHKVFNLAMISQRELQYCPNDEKVRLLQRGRVSDVVTNRNKMTLEKMSDLLNPEDHHRKCRKVILIEGAPGAGKSTLAWYLCEKWEAGELFQGFEIVLFVQLREPIIQSAKYVEDLLPSESSTKREVVSAIQDCRGHKLLVVLDSWDEFTPRRNEQSVIEKLICDPSVLKMQNSALIVTSRPIATAQLQHFISNRIEIAGFLRSEINDYFKEAIGDTEAVEKLRDHLRERPMIEASCYLPLNTVIVTHLFLALGNTLPTTLHGVFTALVLCCIQRHLKKQEEIEEESIRLVEAGRKEEEREGISSLDNLPPGIQNQFNNLCKLAYHGVMENKATFSAVDLRSFKLPTELSTLSLIQGVASFTAFGESRLYNFFHLSTQELLAAFFISQLQWEEQLKIFNELFEQPRFSNVFQFYAGFTKFQTQGIQDTVSRIVKSKDTTRILPLLHCLYETQDDALCQFVASELEGNLDLSQKTLSPVDCLSVGYFVASVCRTTTGQFKLKLTINMLDEYCVTLLVRELAKYCNPSVAQAAAVMETENLYLQLVGERTESSFDERAIVISKLGQYVKALNLRNNQIGTAGAESLGTALKECTKLESLELYNNQIGNAGAESLGTALKECTKLEYLNLRNNQIGTAGAESLGTALKECTKLESLDLGGNKIGPEGVQHLVTVLEKMVQFKELHLYNNNIGNAGAESLGTALKECRKLEYLSLQSNYIGPQGCESLSNGLKQCTKLEHLNLQYNNIGNAGGESLGTALKECTKLEYLNLEGNGIGSQGCESLSNGLKHCTKLEHLNLGGNKIGPEGVQHLVTVLEKMVQLKELHLFNNQIGNAGAESLGTALKECTKLEYLNLAINELNDDCVDAISTSLTKLVHLRKLYLFSNSISDSSIQTLCDFIRSSKSLNYLNLDYNRFTSEGKAKLRKAREERDPDCVELNLSVY